MKKKDILKIIESNEFINRNKKINDFNKNNYNHLFPNIPSLEEEFNILKQELSDKTAKLQEKKECLKKISCNHDVRFHYHAGWVNDSKCIFCGKTINGDNIINGNTIYNSVNRNRKCVMLDTEFLYEDSFGSDFVEGYSEKQIYDIIKDILKDKQDNEEINFIEEFKNLKLDNCKINEQEFEKEYYVLVIGGSNKHYVNQNQYITSDKLLDSIDIAYFLSGIPKVKLELLENNETYKSQKFKDFFPYEKTHNVLFETYKSLCELNEKINSEKHVPFDIIIDLSSLIQYDQIVTPYQLKLKELFPNSYIINILNGESKSELELLKLLKEKLQTYQEAYAYTNKKYYYLNEDNIESSNLEDTCNHIRKLVLKTK